MSEVRDDRFEVKESLEAVFLRLGWRVGGGGICMLETAESSSNTEDTQDICGGNETSVLMYLNKGSGFHGGV